MSLEDDVRRLIDRQDIVDLLHHMCYLIDSFQIDRLAEEIYAPDGSDDHGGGPVVGRDAIREWYTDSTRNVASIAHNIANIVVDVEGDTAKVRSNVISWTWTMSNNDLGPTRPVDYALSVTYHDRLTRYSEGWRINERVLVSNVSKSGAAHIVALCEIPATQTGVQKLAKKPPAEAA
jgi:SnoaL-like protein